MIFVLAVLVIVLQNLMKSPTGRSWIAIREAPMLAESLGIPTARTRVVNVAISGGISALAGGLFVPKIFVLSPDLFGVLYSATGMLSVIVGGKATLIGPVIGGAIFAVLPEAFRFLGDLNFAAFALVLLVAVRLLPDGIVSLTGRMPIPWRLVVRRPAQYPAPVAVSMREAGDPAQKVITVKNVSKDFLGNRAVHDVSFDVHRGEIVGLIGPNGAGKTTLFNLISGFAKPSAGEIRVFNLSIAGLLPNSIAQLGLVRTFQQTAVCANLTVDMNLLIAAHLVEKRSFFPSLIRMPAYRKRERQRLSIALGCLAEMGLSARLQEKAGSLPYGEQKLLGVAMALAAGPSVLLLDEPAAGLNQVEANHLASALLDLKAKGMTLVVVDHNLTMLMSIADRVVVLHHGIKIGDGTPQEVSAQPEVIAAYLGATNKKLGARQILGVHEPRGDQYQRQIRQDRRTARRLVLH